MIVPPTTMTGTFVVTYQICDKHHPDNCSSAPVSIELVDPIFICTDRNATNYDNRTLGGRIRENNTVCRYSTPPSVPSTP